MVGPAVVAVIALVAVNSAPPDEPFMVAGTFILWDDFVADTGELCDAKRSFYHDINRDTEVRLSGGSDVVLAETTLGDGTIISAAELADLVAVRGPGIEEAEAQQLLDQVALEPCLFEFGFIVDPGSDGGEGYVVELGRRGRLVMSEDEIREPGRIQLSVGLRG